MTTRSFASAGATVLTLVHLVSAAGVVLSLAAPAGAQQAGLD